MTTAGDSTKSEIALVFFQPNGGYRPDSGSGK
jgi:hypothetical protein